MTVFRPSRRMLHSALVCGLLVIALPTMAHAVTREAVLRRGEVWVSRKVPYSQSGYANEAGTVVPSSTLGWRRDCSGFVSMALGFVTSTGTPYSADTASLPYRLEPISKDKLLPGDVILRPKNLVIGGKQVPYGHAVVFVRWTDGTKTSYVGYHESSGQGGAVMSQIRYPFYSEQGFSPYRYKNIENVRLRKSLTWYGSLRTTATTP